MERKPLCALDFTRDPSSGMVLDPGMWLSSSGFFGADLVHLYSYIHNVNYSLAAKAIFNAYRHYSEGGDKQIRKLPRWSQNLHPMHDQSMDRAVMGHPNPDDICKFYNADKQCIATVVRIMTESEDIVHVYRTLWRRSGGYRSLWADIYPSKLSFMHEDILSAFPTNPVHIFTDPFDARDANKKNLHHVKYRQLFLSAQKIY